MKSAMPKAKTKSDTANIYGVVGSDEGEVKRVAAELAQKLVPQDAGDFGLEVIDGAADNAEQADARIRSTIEALQTLPFFGSTKVVWLKNANFLGDDPKARSAAVQSALEELSDADRQWFRSRSYASDQRHRSRQATVILQDVGETRGTTGFRPTRFGSSRLGRGSN